MRRLLVSEPIKANWDVEIDIHSTGDLGVALKLRRGKGEDPAFLSPEQARDAAQRLITAAEEVEKKDV